MAPLSSSLVARLKVQLKLSISRLRMTQQRDMALAKQQRRAMALLLEQYKVESARIRVENIIRSDIITELYEILELYCELLLARSQLLETNMNIPSLATSIGNATASALSNRKSSSAAAAVAAAKNPPDPLTVTHDPGLDEAIRSIIFAAPRTDIKELMQVRQLLLEKFGKEVGLQAMEGVGVSERVLKKLKVETPTKSLVDAYLGEIARTYGIAWPDEDDEDSEDSDEEYDEDEPSSGQKMMASDKGDRQRPEKQLEPPLTKDLPQTTESTIQKPSDSTTAPPTAVAKDETEGEEELRLRSASSPPRGDVADHVPSPLRINPPSPRTDNAQPRLKLPGAPEEKPEARKKKKRKGKKDKTKKAKATGESAGKVTADAGGSSKAPDEIEGGDGEGLGQRSVGKVSNVKGSIGESDAANGKDKPGGKIPDIDELARRFAELKR